MGKSVSHYFQLRKHSTTMKLSLLLLLGVISIAHGAPEPLPEPEPEPGAAAAAAAAAAAGAAVVAGYEAIKNLMQSEYENEAMDCYFNDWKARDTTARANCVYNSGRFSKDRKFWGITIGRWYCHYKKAAFEALGHSTSC